MNVHVRAHLGSARFALIAGEFEIWAWRSRCLQFGRFQNGLSTSAHEINVELVPSILANLPDAEGGVLNPIFLLPIHVRLASILRNIIRQPQFPQRDLDLIHFLARNSAVWGDLNIKSDL